MESQYSCSCKGCTCTEPHGSPTDNAGDSSSTAAATTTTTTTTAELIVSAAQDPNQSPGTIPVEISRATTTKPCPPGHHCGGAAAPTTRAAATTIAAATTTTTPAPPLEPSCLEMWVGDKFCDDGNNVALCNWDGGDCCGAQVKKAYCHDCRCVDPALAPYYNCGGAAGTICETPDWEGACVRACVRYSVV